MESASGMDKAETSAHTLASADSWRKCNRKDVDHATGTHKGGAQNAESWKHNSRNPHLPMETQMLKSSSNSSFGSIGTLDLNELLPMNIQPLNTHNTYQATNVPLRMKNYINPHNQPGLSAMKETYQAELIFN